jgi:type IX secretion system PorP/SprF family membrane protein
MRKIFILALLITSAAIELRAQDPAFTQFYANPLYLNPAFAGSVRCPRFALAYRNQWPNIQGTYSTYSASYDQHVDALSGGIGIMAWADDAGKGTLKTQSYSGIYSYQLNVSRTFSIKAGFQATYQTKKLDWTKLNFGDQIDDRNGFIYKTLEQNPDNKSGIFDVSAGFLGFTKRYFFGFAAHHITQPNESVLGSNGNSPLPRKFTGHAGAMIPLGNIQNEAFISPNILFMKQNNFQQLNLGLYFQKGPFLGGIWYRNQDAFIQL